MNRCTVIDRLEDEYGIKLENLTEREKAIIGLCTNEFLANEEEALRIPDVVGQSEQLKAFGKSLQYKGVRILTDEGVEQAVKDFESL